MARFIASENSSKVLNSPGMTAWRIERLAEQRHKERINRTLSRKIRGIKIVN